MQQVVHEMLHGSGVDYEVVPMTYRDGPVPAKRERRIAAAMNRLARNRGATPLPDPAALALSAGLPLALVVPVPALAPVSDSDELTRGYARIGEDTAAIAGRVRPALDRIGLPAGLFCAPYRSDVTLGSPGRGMGATLEEVARRLRAQAVAVSATSSALHHMRLPADVLHVVEPAAQTKPPDNAHSTFNGPPLGQHVMLTLDPQQRVVAGGLLATRHPAIMMDQHLCVPPILLAASSSVTTLRAFAIGSGSVSTKDDKPPETGRFGEPTVSGPEPVLGGCLDVG